MGEWRIRPSYKMDLACFCNLFFEDPHGLKKHREGYERFKDVIKSRDDLGAFVKESFNKGLMVGVYAASVLALIDYDGYDIDEICKIFEDEAMYNIIEASVIENNIPIELYKGLLLPILPKLGDLLRYVHDNGFKEYWLGECLPELQSRIKEFEISSEKYPVIKAVNDLLGFKKVQDEYLDLYLCKFVAPYGIGLNHGFISDASWNFEDTVSVAVHELIHAPFSRKRIAEMTDILFEDDFVQEAKAKLPPTSGYSLPAMFIEENFVEGTHIYLSEKLGVEKDPLTYLINHDFGSHVLSVILYDALKKGYREKEESIEKVVERLMEENILTPGNMRKRYQEIYEEAGLGDKHPFVK